MNLRIAGVFCLIALGFVMGCESSDNNSTTRIVTEADNGSTISLDADTTLEVRLQGNPTTGYEWRVAELDTASLRLTSSHYEPEPAGDRVGVGGTYFFRFDQIKAGSSKLRLVYKRPWEDSRADKSYTLTVVTTGRG